MVQRHIPDEHSVQLLGCVNLEISKNKFQKIDQSLQFLYYHININPYPANVDNMASSYQC